MAESHVQSRVAKTTPSPQTQSPRWGKRILENLRIAGAATVLSGALALSACGGIQVEPVAPTKLRNPICDPKIGTVYHRPDGMDAIVTNPTDCGQNSICSENNIIPLISLAFYYRKD